MIAFSTIFDKAINLIDDPFINKAYMEDDIMFQKTMLPYLMQGVDDFQNPSIIHEELLDQTPPQGKLETFTGNGSATYTLSTTPSAEAQFICKVNGVIDNDAVYTPANNSITFSQIVETGVKCSAEWYVGGKFNSDFTRCASPTTTAAYIQDQVIGILARATVLAWTTQEKNFLLDIRNLLRTSDFELYSNANSLRAKVEWYRTTKLDFDTMTNSLSWRLLSRKYHGGKFYG